MKYQTLQNSCCAVFKMLGGCWLLSGGVVGRDVFRNAESEYYTLTLYYQNTELVSITFDDGLKDPGKKYMVYVNQPYYENGKSTFVVRQKETDKQYIFLETGSAKVAFNMVNRIVSGMRYPKAKMIW